MPKWEEEVVTVTKVNQKDSLDKDTITDDGSQVRVASNEGRHRRTMLLRNHVGTLPFCQKKNGRVREPGKEALEGLAGTSYGWKPVKDQIEDLRKWEECFKDVAEHTERRTKENITHDQTQYCRNEERSGKLDHNYKNTIPREEACRS